MALLGFKPLPFEADPSLWVLFHDPQVRNSLCIPGHVVREAACHIAFKVACRLQSFARGHAIS